MNIAERIKCFSLLGNFLKSTITQEGEVLSVTDSQMIELRKEWSLAIKSAAVHNQWFTQENSEKAVLGISRWLFENELVNWTSTYKIHNMLTRNRVGIIMAGNIPLVGFHDMLAVLLSGHIAVCKLSSDDKVLLPVIKKVLVKIDPRWEDQLLFVDRLKDIDAVIATGSNNSMRYFESYFGKYPHLFRGNRTSLAILNKDTSDQEIELLTNDMLQYYGLGCRNITQLLLPNNFNIDRIFKAIHKSHQHISNHNKYMNNYTYNKAIYLMGQEDILDNGFVLLKKTRDLFSPVGVINYDFYNSTEEIKEYVHKNLEKIQCVVMNASKEIPNAIAFGKAQEPTLTDYADGVDTMLFIQDAFLPKGN